MQSWPVSPLFFFFNSLALEIVLLTHHPLHRVSGLRKKRKKAKMEPSLTKSETSKAISQETPEARSHAASPETITQEISVVDAALVGA